MALASTPTGIYFPNHGPTRLLAVANGNTLNAATDKTCLVGHVYWEGRAASKTISSSGGAIMFRAGAVTFANGSTTLDVGIQDVDSANGPVVRGDGTFDVKKTHQGGTDTINATAFNTISMATGSKTITHGDLVAVVF